MTMMKQLKRDRAAWVIGTHGDVRKRARYGFKREPWVSGDESWAYQKVGSMHILAANLDVSFPHRQAVSALVSASSPSQERESL